jgi:hypothetical protein
MEIENTLLEVAAWCDARAPISDLRFGLRSTELKPHLSERPDSNELAGAVLYLANRRRQLLVSRASDDYVLGRVLVCEYNMSVTSGESEHVTRGFFDVADRPPWDSWICSCAISIYRREADLILFSWVPEYLVSVVTEGISVNPYGCLYWLRDAPRPLAESPLAESLNKCG